MGTRRASSRLFSRKLYHRMLSYTGLLSMWVGGDPRTIAHLNVGIYCYMPLLSAQSQRSRARAPSPCRLGVCRGAAQSDLQMTLLAPPLQASQTRPDTNQEACLVPKLMHCGCRLVRTSGKGNRKRTTGHTHTSNCSKSLSTISVSTGGALPRRSSRQSQRDSPSMRTSPPSRCTTISCRCLLESLSFTSSLSITFLVPFTTQQV
jgi:hypothetical protein